MEFATARSSSRLVANRSVSEQFQAKPVDVAPPDFNPRDHPILALHWFSVDAPPSPNEAVELGVIEEEIAA